MYNLNRDKIRLNLDAIASKFTFGVGVLTILFIFIIIVGLSIKSYPILKTIPLKKILLSSNWHPNEGHFGLLSFVISTLCVTIISIIISVPICLLASTYITEYASKKIKLILMPIIDVLAGLPSVIFGLWGVLIIVPFVSYLGKIIGAETEGYSLLAAGLVLSVMVFPILINIFCEILNVVPKDLREATLSLGATQWETIKTVVYRKALPGIFAAIILGFSRALGETIAVLMVVGNNPYMPSNIFDMGYPLPALIANNYGEMMSIPMYESALMMTALLLLFIILIFNIIGRYILLQLVKNK